VTREKIKDFVRCQHRGIGGKKEDSAFLRRRKGGSDLRGIEQETTHFSARKERELAFPSDLPCLDLPRKKRLAYDCGAGPG